MKFRYSDMQQKTKHYNNLWKQLRHTTHRKTLQAASVTIGSTSQAETQA
jgi:hypothetical protein